MTITFLDTNTMTPAATNTAVVTMSGAGGAYVVGQLMVAFVTQTANTGTFAFLTAASGWNPLTDQADAALSFSESRIFWRVVAAGELGIQTVATTSVSVANWPWMTCQIVRYSGFSTASPAEIDAALSDFSAGSKTSPSVTPTAGVERLIIGAAYDENFATATFSGEQIGGTTTGVSERSDSGGAAIWDKIVASTSGSYAATAIVTGGGANGGGCHIAVFQPTGAAPPSTAANICTLSDGTDTISWYDYTVASFADDGHDMGVPGASPRVLKLQTRLHNNVAQLSLSQLELLIGKLRALLSKAERTTTLGLPRQVILTLQPNGLAVSTRFYVLGGSVPPVAPMRSQYLVNHVYDELPLTLIVEPWGYGVETALVASGALYGRASIDVRFIATGASGTGVDGTAAGVNVAALSSGSLAQNNKLTTTPTLQTMANQLAFYFGCTFATFDRLVMGIETAKAGTLSGVWEIWTGAAWAGIATTSDFRSGAESTEFDTARRLGAIILTGSTAGWATKAITVNAVSTTAFWLRYRITSQSGATAPVFMNGPVRCLSNLASIAAGAVPGDSEAAALVHLINPGAVALAGVKAAFATGELTNHPPPFVIDLAGADLYIPTGDTTVAVTADTNANDGDRVDLGLVQTILDRAQTLDGTAENITLTPSAADKLETLPAGDFYVEVLFKADLVPTTPRCLASQWSGTLTTSSWWLGIDQGKLKFMISGTDGKRKDVRGATAIPVGTWVLATGIWDSGAQQLIIKRDGNTERVNSVSTVTVRNGLATALRIGRSVGFTTADSLSGTASEGFFKGAIANVRLVADTPTGQYGTAEAYTAIALTTAITLDSAATRWLLKMEDNAASLTIVDSATTFAAAKNAARSAANTSTRTTVGYFQPGAGQVAQVLGLNLPRTWAEEHRGRVRILLRATPAATLTSVDDVLFQLQLNVGDSALPLGPPGHFPNIEVPGNNGYYLVDLGVFSLPGVALRDTGPFGTLTSAKNVLQANLFVQHNFSVATTLRLDCLYLLPTSTWYGQYASFRNGNYSTTYDIEQNTGVLFDSLGPETVVGQSTTVGYTDPFRNPYAEVGGADRVKLIPNKPAWLFAIPLRGIFPGSGDDYLDHVLGDSLTPAVRAVGCYDVLAVA